MACLVGYGAYRTEVVRHAVPVRLIGPDGRQHRQLSRALSRVWTKQPSREKALRYVKAFVWTLNVAHAEMPDIADRYVADVDACRDAQDQFVVSANIRTDEAAERDGSMCLHPKKKQYSRVSDALVATGMVTDALTHEVYGGQDPSKVDHRVSRVAKKAQGARPDPRNRRDVDRRLRLGADPNHAPRYDDPRFWGRWEEGLVAIDAPEVFRHVGAMGRYAGGRAFQVSALTIFDLLVRAAEEGEIPAPNKGSRGERTMVFKPIRSSFDAMMGWVAGERAKLTGKSLDELKLIAADPRRRHELKTMFLFTEDGVNPINTIGFIACFGVPPSRRTSGSTMMSIARRASSASPASTIYDMNMFTVDLMRSTRWTLRTGRLSARR